MELSTAVGYAVGFILLLVVLQLLAKPIAITARLLGNALLGGVVLWGLNWLGSLVGWQIGLNPVSAVVVGILGVPGLAGLALLRMLFP